MAHLLPRRPSTTGILHRPQASGVLAAIALVTLLFHFPSLTAAAEHEVRIYSVVTEHGRTAPSPAHDMIRCRLFSGGYQELGRVISNPLSAAPAAESVRDVLAEGLRGSGFRPVMDDAPADQLLVFHWGYMDPRREEPLLAELSRREWRAMFELLGAAAALKSGAEREELAAALSEDRYFLVVSAYDDQAFAATRERRLLWRSHLSVPAGKLSHEQALPILVGAGVALFGRETIVPRRISIPLRASGLLRLNPALRRPAD